MTNNKIIDLDYYYGKEADQFSFYRVPKLLVKDERFKGLSSDAKLLYGLMLDRMSLSMKNGWLDDQNRAYIYYTMDEIMDDLGCAKEKCAKIISEIDDKKGVGLIKKVRQGLGKPDIIYVMNFASEKKSNDNDRIDNVPTEENTIMIEENIMGQAEKNIAKEPSNPDVYTEVRKPNNQKFENQILIVLLTNQKIITITKMALR